MIELPPACREVLRKASNKICECLDAVDLTIAHTPVLHEAGSLSPVQAILLENGNYRLDLSAAHSPSTFPRHLFGAIGAKGVPEAAGGTSAAPDSFETSLSELLGGMDPGEPGFAYGPIDVLNVRPETLRIMRARFLLTRDAVYQALLENTIWPYSARKELVARFFPGGVWVPEGTLREKMIQSLQRTGFADGSIPAEATVVPASP